MNAHVRYFFRNGSAWSRLSGTKISTGALCGAPSVDEFDPHERLGKRLVADLEASAALRLTDQESRAAGAATDEALGYPSSGTRLYRSCAIVDIDGDETGISVGTVLYGRKVSEQSWPSRTVPWSTSPEELAELFRRFVTTAQRFLLERDMIKGDLTFPDSPGIDDE